MTDKDLSYFLTITREQRDFLESCVNDLAAYKYIGALEECREAVEKQIRKPAKNPYGTSYIWKAGYCPVCGCGVTARWDYCQCCGQHIWWGEKNWNRNELKELVCE